MPLTRKVSPIRSLEILERVGPARYYLWKVTKRHDAVARPRCAREQLAEVSASQNEQRSQFAATNILTFLRGTAPGTPVMQHCTGVGITSGGCPACASASGVRPSRTASRRGGHVVSETRGAELGPRWLRTASVRRLGADSCRSPARLRSARSRPAGESPQLQRPY